MTHTVLRERERERERERGERERERERERRREREREREKVYVCTELIVIAACMESLWWLSFNGRES